MRTIKAISVAIVSSLIALTSANAATVNFTFTGANYDVTGNFTYDPSSGAITDVKGDVKALTLQAGSGGGIVALVNGPSSTYPPGQPGYYPDGYPGNGFTFTNIFDPVARVFTENGVLFSFGNGNYGSLYYSNSAALFSTWLPDGPGTPPDYSDFGPLYNPGDGGTLSFSAAIPEPSTWAMLFLGFLAIGYLQVTAPERRAKRLASNTG